MVIKVEVGALGNANLVSELQISESAQMFSWPGVAPAFCHYS